MKKLSAVMAAAALAATGLVAAAPAAHADLVSQCYGNQVAGSPWVIKKNGAAIGRVEVWYSSLDGGTNCVMTRNYQPGRQWTMARLKIADGRARTDEDNFKLYAGGVRFKHTNHKCIKWAGMVSGVGWVQNNWANCG